MEKYRLTSILLVLMIFYCGSCSSKNVSPVSENKTTQFRLAVSSGKYPYSPELARLVAIEEDTWHWLPWHHVRTKVVDDTLEVKTCKGESSSFPDDIFTHEQLLDGAIILHFIAIIYAFTLLATICDEYFIPAVECICEDLKISKDVAAATFMATATSCPEFFVNVMSTFITESDLGIGTIVGSALFNILGVAAIGSFAAPFAIQIARWPVTRDSCIYMFNVIILIIFVWDDKVVWWEAAIFLCLYFIYFIVIFNSHRIQRLLQKFCCATCNSTLGKRNTIVGDLDHENEVGHDNLGFELSENTKDNKTNGDVEKKAIENSENIDEDNEDDEPLGICSYPKGKSVLDQIIYIYRYPIKLVLTFLIPSTRKWRHLYPLTFIMCIIVIGVNSYFVSWMITTIGETFDIPDSIMGMTFLSFGGCLPETFSLFVVARKGKGEMGVSNSLGANSLAILFSLSIPWFIKCMILIGNGEEGEIGIDSAGMNYIVISILFAVIALYIVLMLTKFTLRKLGGLALIIIYLIFVTFAILVESNIFFPVTLPPC